MKDVLNLSQRSISEYWASCKGAVCQRGRESGVHDFIHLPIKPVMLKDKWQTPEEGSIKMFAFTVFGISVLVVRLCVHINRVSMCCPPGG